MLPACPGPYSMVNRRNCDNSSVVRATNDEENSPFCFFDTF